MGNYCEKQTERALEIQDIQNNDQKNQVDNGPSPSYAFAANPPPLPDRINSVLFQARKTHTIKNDLGLRSNIPQEVIYLPWHYIPSRKLYYKGAWKNKNPHGYGEVQFDHNSYFQGRFNDGEADCDDGIFVLQDGSVYKGSLKNSKMNGFGIYEHVDNLVRYEGQWQNGKPHGKGKETFKNGNFYEGKFENGLKHGKGVFTWKNGMIYQGQFKLGFMWGEGQLRKDDCYYKGEFYKSMKDSQNDDAIMRTACGEYKGGFREGKMDGNGQFIWKDQKKFKGYFKNGNFHGLGQISFPNGQKAKGVWIDGENQELIQVNND